MTDLLIAHVILSYKKIVQTHLLYVMYIEAMGRVTDMWDMSVTRPIASLSVSHSVSVGFKLMRSLCVAKLIWRMRYRMMNAD